MSNKPTNIQPVVPQHSPETAGGALRGLYESQKTLFEAQPASVQRFLAMQARTLTDALLQGASHVRFKLPDRIILDASGQITPIPASFLDQMVGGLMTSLTGADLRAALRNHLGELEGSDEPAVSAVAGIVRYVTAHTMVHDLLPAGRSVQYTTLAGEAIPSEPVTVPDEAASAITAETDAIAEQGDETVVGDDGVRGDLIVPYVPAARRFYLPQWVAFDDEDHLLVKSTQEAEGMMASMQRFLSILHTAVGLAPYMVADEEYQRKRYGMLGQLVNQGRALALHQTREVIDTIHQRAAANDLNRGLSLSLPYFDDQDLAMKLHHFQIIPAGRIMFVPAFVVRATHEEQAKVAQDTRLNASTRKYLLKELQELEAAFALPSS